MLHIKFRGNLSTGSGEEDFFKVFTIYGHGSHLGHVTSIPIKEIFISSYLKAYTQNLIKIAQCFLRKASFNLHM